jgi:PKD repeat protein
MTLSVAATDAGVNSLTYTWNFDDETTGAGSTVTHTYTSPGVYNVTVTVSNGATSTSATVTVIINPTSDTTDPTQFKVLKSSVKFTFDNKTNADSMSFSGTLPVATGFEPNQKILNVYIGGYTSTFTLSSKGKDSINTDSITLSGKLSKTGGYSASPVKFTYSVKKQNLFDDLQEFGFSNATVTGQSITVPVLMDLAGDGYLADVTLTYTAKKGKTGSAK